MQGRIAPLYDPSGLRDGYTIWKNPLMILQSFIRRRDGPIDDQWSNVNLSELNNFLVGRCCCPLDGVVTNQILTGVPRYCISEASVRIQSTFRRFQACNRRNRMIHAGTKIQRCLHGCYMHRRWKRLAESALNRRWGLLV